MRNIIYGVGVNFEEYVISTEHALEDVTALIDKSESMQGRSVEGITVFAPTELPKLEYDYIFVSSLKYYESIRTELLALGCEGEKIKRLEYKKTKYSGELAYWRKVYRAENGIFQNSFYKDIFLGISNETSDSFMKNKVIADFGCGPRGSLAWTDAPKVKIGIDVLANQYMRYFADSMSKHGMIYLNSDEYKIPLPDNYVDIISTINSLDHVSVLDNMVEEILRVLKPGGAFLGSFNLNEPSTQCEPQTLTEELLNNKLFSRLNVLEKRIARKGEKYSYSEIVAGRLVETIWLFWHECG